MKPDRIEAIQKALNGFHEKINFTYESEKEIYIYLDQCDDFTIESSIPMAEQI